MLGSDRKKLKQQAIDLRKQGKSYSEILKIVPIAKSTLSYWLRSIRLSKKQKQKLDLKRIRFALKGANVRKKQRIDLEDKIKKVSLGEIGKISDRELWLIGIVLYWSEGAKAKSHNVSQGVIFSNSDPIMIKLFLKWLLDCVHMEESRIHFELYVHREQEGRVEELKEYWAHSTGFSRVKFGKIYFKQNNPRTKRKKIDNNYYGQIRVKVSKSTNLNRQIAGWFGGIANYCRVG